MKPPRNKFLFSWTLPFYLLAAAAPAQADNPNDFEAVYEFIRNGKVVGEARFSFTSQGDQWVMNSQSKGTRGMAKWLGFTETSSSRGNWLDGQARPEKFEQHIKVAIKKIDVLAEFNWANGTVRSVYEDGESTLELGDGVLDPVSIGLVIRAGLRNGEDEWRPMMVDEDEIEEQHFRAQPESMLDTSLGCLEVRNVEKIRAPESSRYTRTWYATDLDYVPVFIEHGKKDGDHMETRIRSLTLDGQSVSAKAGC